MQKKLINNWISQKLKRIQMKKWKAKAKIKKMKRKSNNKTLEILRKARIRKELSVLK